MVAPPRARSHWPRAPPLTGSRLQVVFEKGGVYLHTSAKKHQDPDSLIAGVIRVVEKVGRQGAELGQARSGMEAASIGAWGLEVSDATSGRLGVRTRGGVGGAS